MSLPEQVAALSGVIQAARLVDRIAVAGTCPSEPFKASINSLFTFDATSTEDVYAGFDSLTLGLETLVALFGKTPDASLQHVLRYTLGILHLERKFSADKTMQALVHSRLEHVSYKATHFTNDPRSLSHNIAAIYQDSLSQLSFRIKIIGNSEYLSQEVYADQIRSLLLAGIRSAYLWRQLGGRRWRLMWQRKSMLAAAAVLLQNTESDRVKE